MKTTGAVHYSCTVTNGLKVLRMAKHKLPSELNPLGFNGPLIYYVELLFCQQKLCLIFTYFPPAPQEPAEPRARQSSQVSQGWLCNPSPEHSLASDRSIHPILQAVGTDKCRSRHMHQGRALVEEGNLELHIFCSQP